MFIQMLPFELLEYPEKAIQYFFPSSFFLRIDDGPLLRSFRLILKPILLEKHLEALSKGTPSFTMEFMLRYYGWLVGGLRPDTPAFQMLTAVSTTRPSALAHYPTDHRTTLSYIVGKCASLGMRYCWVRIDQDNRSICSGDTVMLAQFCFVEILDLESCRVWFHHPQDPALISMDLSAGEMLHLKHRISFCADQTTPPAWTWPSATGSAKLLVYRARYTTMIPKGLVAIRQDPIRLEDELRRQIPSPSPR